jgi:hypothetical protein
VSPQATRVTAIVLLVVVAIAGAAGVSYYLQQRRIDDLQAQLLRQQSQLSQQRLQTAALTARLEQRKAASTAPPAEGGTGTYTSPAETPQPQAATKPKTVEQFAFVTKAAESGDAIKLTLDYAQFLTGDAAARAAQAAGGESPPPNDFYIANTNAKLRVLPVSPKAKFTISLGGPDQTTVLSAGQFLDAIAGNADGAADSGYWFTIRSGVVTGGKEQWTP